MLKKISYIIGLLVVGYLSYHYPLFAFVLLVILFLTLLYVLIAALVRWIRHTIHGNWFYGPLAIISIVLAGLMMSLIAPLEEPVIQTGNPSEELAYAYKMDQGDRKNLKFFLAAFKSIMRGRDNTRLSQVLRYTENNELDSGMDRFHAAFVLHHNPARDSALYHRAHELAKQAASEPSLSDNFQVQWLAKATYDRWMLSIGEEQKYNTQGGVSFEIQ